MKSLFGKFLIIAAVLLALFALWRGFLYSPNGEIGGEPSTATAEELPRYLSIPKLGIDSNVQHVGVTKAGNMAAPNNFTDVSWYKFGAVPGFKGSAVMAGHVDNALGTPAIFYKLGDLEVGDEIFVTRADGEQLRFKVIDKQVYPWDDSPVEKIFNDKSGTYLNLITCQGDWVPAAKSAEFRLVIYTKLVE